MLAAKTRRSRDLCNIRNRQRIVAPFTCTVVWPVVSPSAKRNTGSRAAAQNNRKHNVEACARSIGRLGRSQAIGVILNADLATKGSAQISLDGRPINQVELAPFPRRDLGSSEPGMPIPTEPVFPVTCSV